MRLGAGSAAAASALLGAALFVRTVCFDYTFDDAPQIRDNRGLRAGDGWKRVFSQRYWGFEQNDGLYRPLTQLTFWAQVAGGDGRGPPPPATWLHLVNALLHGAVAGLVALVAARLCGSPAAALAAGALFAVHPLHVEAVTGLVGRAELLAALFVLSALLLRGRPGLGARAAESALFLLALLSKESAATYGLLAPLWDRVILGRPFVRSLRALAGPAAVFALYLGLHRLATGSWLWPQTSRWWGDHEVARIGTGFHVLGRYVLLMLAPVTLSADYSFDQLPLPRSLLEARVLLPALGLLALAAGGVALVRRRRLPEVGLGILFFLLAFAATANVLFATGTPMGERLAYLPSVGPCLAATAALRWRHGRVLVALATLALGARTLARLPDWKDDFTLFRKTVETSPRSYKAWLKLASLQFGWKEYAEAESNYGRALAILPTSSEAWNDLGLLYKETGRPKQALAAFAEAVRVLPRSADGHYNLGSLLMEVGRAREAIPHLEEALRLRPDRLQPMNNLGVAWMKLGDFGRSAACFERVLAVDPRNGTALMNRAVLHLLEGRADEAIALYDRAIAEGDPRSTRQFWRDVAEAMRRGLPWASVDAVRAIRESGGSPPADLYLRLAELCRSAGYAHPDRARAYLQTWLEMSPGHPDAARVRAEVEGAGGK